MNHCEMDYPTWDNQPGCEDCGNTDARNVRLASVHYPAPLVLLCDEHAPEWIKGAREHKAATLRAERANR